MLRIKNWYSDSSPNHVMWTLYTMTERNRGLTLPQTPIFSSKNKWKGQKGYIYTSLQSSGAETFWAIANPLGWKQLLIITYRGKVSVLGLATVSIPKICVWRNMFRQDWNKCTREFKKWIASQRKMLQNTSTDDRQVGEASHVLSALLNSRHANTDSTAKPSENALCLDSLCITEQNYLTT